MRFVEALRRFWKKFLANLKTNRGWISLDPVNGPVFD